MVNSPKKVLQKSKYPIGIFGSFSPRNKEFLSSLKKFLNKVGYKAKISEDLKSKYPQKTGENIHQYSRRLSKALIDESVIHVLFIFFEEEGEHNINQSVSMEIEIINHGMKRHVLVLLEKNSFDQNKSVFKGLRDPVNHWRWEDFIRYDPSNKKTYKDKDIETSVMMVCLDFIEEMANPK